MRSEKIKRYLIMALVGVLVLLAPLSYLRVLIGSRKLWQIELDTVYTGTHIITDRDGTELFNGDCLAPDVVGNLVGNEEYINEALYTRYKEDMTVAGFNPLVGMESLKGTTLKTTLMPLPYQQQIKELYGDYTGACFAYNYITGEVYVAMSLPSGLPAGDGTTLPEGSMHNGCLNGTYIPASTMKILTTVCALAQDPELAKFKFTCRQKYDLPDGNTVICHDYHGELDLADALGESCNCYMAALIRKLDAKKAEKTLAQLGIVNEGAKAVEDERRGVMGKLTYNTGSTIFSSFNEFNSVWSLVGQGKTRANPVYMAMAAAAVANGGTVAQPWIMQSIAECGTDVVWTAPEAESLEFIDAETARLTKMVWELAVKEHYHNEDKPLVPEITLAKTGTGEEDNGINDRLLLGVMEEYQTAFFIILEDSAAESGLVFEVANLLAEAIGNM